MHEHRAARIERAESGNEFKVVRSQRLICQQYKVISDFEVQIGSQLVSTMNSQVSHKGKDFVHILPQQPRFCANVIRINGNIVDDASAVDKIQETANLASDAPVEVVVLFG